MPYSLIRRGEVWWAALQPPTGSGPGFRRPLLIVSADEFNASAIRTVTAAVITSSMRLANAPGNVRLAARSSGLSKVSVVNVSQVVTVDKTLLQSRAGRVPSAVQAAVDAGLRLALALG